MAKLILKFSNGESITHDLLQEEITLGRAPSNDISLEDPSVSGYHAKLVQQGEDRYLVKDLQSTNGTRVNGERISEKALSAGDQIHFGNLLGEYRSEKLTSSQPAPAKTPSTKIEFSGASEGIVRFPPKEVKRNPVLVAAILVGALSCLASLGAAACVALMGS